MSLRPSVCRLLLLGFLSLFATARVSADTVFQYYDLDALGVPKFVNVVYIDLTQISQISKFRSSAGHPYRDDIETCRSMKHYFIQPDNTVTIRSPVAGDVTANCSPVPPPHLPAT